LDEVITYKMSVGAALILSGIALTTGLIKRRNRKVHEN